MKVAKFIVIIELNKIWGFEVYRSSPDSKPCEGFSLTPLKKHLTSNMDKISSHHTKTYNNQFFASRFISCGLFFKCYFLLKYKKIRHATSEKAYRVGEVGSGAYGVIYSWYGRQKGNHYSQCSCHCSSYKYYKESHVIVNIRIFLCYFVGIFLNFSLKYLSLSSKDWLYLQTFWIVLSVCLFSRPPFSIRRCVRFSLSLTICPLLASLNCLSCKVETSWHFSPVTLACLLF